MKKSIEALVVVQMIAVIAAMAIAGVSGLAHAEPAQQFSFQVLNPRPGSVGVHLQTRAFDTTGAVPQTPTEYTIRLPRGVELDPAFLGGGWFCDARALRDALDARPSAVPFTKRIANLRPFMRELARSGTKRDRAALATARTCERARLGGGTGGIDIRAVVPHITELVPVGFAIFLSRGTIPGAIAGFAVVGAADETSAVVRRDPVLAGVHAVLTENLVSDPTSDGLYDKKVVLYTGPINTFQVSVAEVDAVVHGIELRRGACLRRGRGGRCTRRQRADASLFSVPSCPPAGHLSAELFTGFAPPTPSLTTTLQLPCPRYAT